MFLVLLSGIAVYTIYTYRESIQKTVAYFAASKLKTKLMTLLFFITAFLLVFPEVVPNSLVTIGYIYLFIANGFQAWSIFKTGKEYSCPWPKGATTLMVSALLVLWTPLADMFLNRSYDSKAGVIFAASSLAFILLYMIEVYQRNNKLIVSELSA